MQWNRTGRETACLERMRWQRDTVSWIDGYVCMYVVNLVRRNWIYVGERASLRDPGCVYMSILYHTLDLLILERPIVQDSSRLMNR